MPGEGNNVGCLKIEEDKAWHWGRMIKLWSSALLIRRR